MDQTEILIRILLTIVFGAVLGLESETREIEIKGKKKAQAESKSKLGGLRTYTVLSLIGGISGLLYVEGIEILVYVIFAAIIALVTSAYILNIQKKDAFGLTTEVAILITFLIGFLTTSGLLTLPVILTILVLLTFFLSQKRGFGLLIEKIGHNELIDVSKFGLLAAVILPLLPNEDYFVKDIVSWLELGDVLTISNEVGDILLLNPFRIWLIVVIITGINLGSYILSKTIGKKNGILISSAVGGIVSSTSTTVALATKSKEASKKNTKIFAGGAILANAVSLPTIFLVISVLSPELAGEIFLPLSAMFLFGLSIGLWLVLNDKEKKKEQTIEVPYEPFSVAPALKFVGLILLLTFLIQVIQIVDSHALLIIVTALSGLVGMDAPSIATSELVQNGELSIAFGAVLFLITNAVNFGAKGVYSYLSGSRLFAKYVWVGLGLTLLGTLFVLI